MGDLNLTPPTPEKVTGWQSLAAGPTFPVEEPDRQLDHVLLRGSFAPVTAVSAPALPLSDHRALTVDIGR